MQLSNNRRQLVWEYDLIDKDVYSHCICICHTWRLRVDDVSCFSMQLNPDEEEFVIVSKDQNDFVDKDTGEMCDKDACTWSYIGKPTVEAKPSRLRGIGRKTMILELFCGVMTLALLASRAGWPISQLSEVMLDGLDLAKKSCRHTIDQQIERDNFFVLVMAFP